MRAKLLVVLETVCAVAVWAIVALLAAGGLERNLAGTSYLGNTDDVIAILMAASFVLGLPVALARGGHVRVDSFYRLYPPKLKAAADFVFKLFGIAAGVGLTAAGIALVLDSYSRERMFYGVVEMPLWILQLIIVIGAAAFALEFMFGAEEPDSDPIEFKPE